MLSLMAFMAVFTAVVLVHELGHFLAARKAGVKVYEFSIGFPFSPRLVTLFRHKETAFTIRLLPLGGFVSFGPDGGEDDGELLLASRSRRALILAAGPLFNVLFAFLIFVPAFMAGKDLGPFDALALSAKSVWEIASGTVLFLGNAVTGHGTMEGVAGPVGIAVLAGKAASKGLLHVCYFTGILSMGLGIMNLLPLPALDGGQLIMVAVESLRRKPLSPRIYQAATLVGIALFLIFTALVTYKDVLKLIA